MYTPPPSGGKELGYAEKTAAQTGIGTSATDVTSLSVTVTVGTRPIEITAFCNWQKKTSASYVDLEIYDNTAGARVALTELSAGVDEYGSSFVKVRENPAAGSRTYKVRARAGAGTVDLAADATYPAHIHVVELSQ